MPDPQTNAAKQRLLDLRVGEISLVDVPANEEEFAIIKSLEGDMATKPEDTKDNGNSEAGAPPSPDQQAEAVTKAAETLVAELEKRGGKKPKDEDMEKALPPPLANALKKLVEMIQQMLGGQAKAEKAAGEKPADTSVEKGGKQFSKERMEKMSNALTILASLMKDVDGDAFAQLLQALDPANANKGVHGGGGDDKDKYPYPKPTMKEMEEAVGKALAPLTERLSAVSKRVEAVEKGAAVSKAAPGDGNDKPQETKKSLWSGVL